MTRILLAALLLPLAACSGGEEAGNNATAPAPVPSPTGPPSKTPRLEVPVAQGNTASWIEPRDAATPAPVAPYGNVLEGAVVTGGVGKR